MNIQYSIWTWAAETMKLYKFAISEVFTSESKKNRSPPWWFNWRSFITTASPTFRIHNINLDILNYWVLGCFVCLFFKSRNKCVIVFGSHNQNQQGHHSQDIAFDLTWFKSQTHAHDTESIISQSYWGLWAPLGGPGLSQVPLRWLPLTFTTVIQISNIVLAIYHNQARCNDTVSSNFRYS